MTISEQIFAYKELKKNGQAFFVDTYEDADRIIESLEKQIPKKPKRNNTIASKIFHKTSCYTCPTCRNGLLTKMMNERQNTRFCWDCGQRLDWGEGEKE